MKKISQRALNRGGYTPDSLTCHSVTRCVPCGGSDGRMVYRTRCTLIDILRSTPCDFPIQWFGVIGLLLGLPLTAAADVISRQVSFRTAFGFEIFSGGLSLIMFVVCAYVISSHEQSSCALVAPRLWIWLKFNTLVNSVSIFVCCTTVILSSTLVMVSSRVKPEHESHMHHRFKTYYGTV